MTDGEVYVYIDDNDGEYGHLEVFDTKPTFELRPGSKLYVANINGGDSMLVGEGMSWEPAPTTLTRTEIVTGIRYDRDHVTDDLDRVDEVWAHMAGLFEMLPKHLRISLAGELEVCPVHLTDEHACNELGREACWEFTGN